MNSVNFILSDVSPACAAFLHDLGSVVSRQLTEAVITVNYGPVHNLSVSKQEACL